MTLLKPIAHTATGLVQIGASDAIDLAAYLETPQAVTYASAVALDVSARNDFVLGVLTADCFVSFVNVAPGRQGVIWVAQDSTGGRKVTFILPPGCALYCDQFSDLVAQTAASSITRYVYTFATIGGALTLQLSSTYRLKLSSFPLSSLTVTPNAAWSVNERMFSAYTGPLFRLRRSSDGTETDISAVAATGLCDQAAITAFCGAGNGSVKTLYDQSGNSRDLTQATAGNQPVICTAGVVNKSGSNVAMAFNGATSSRYLQRADLCGLPATNPAYSVAQLQSSVAGAVSQITLSFGNSSAWTGSGTYNGNLWVSQTAYLTYYGTDALTYHYDIWTHAAGVALNAYTARQNGVAKPYTSGPAGSVNMASGGSTWLGGTQDSFAFASGNISTALVWGSVISAADIALTEAWLEQRRVA